MLSTHLLLAVLWMVYCVLHSVLAALGTKAFFQRHLGEGFRYYRLAYTLFAFAGLAGIVSFQLTIASINLFTPTLLTRAAGGAVGAVGLAVMGLCVKKYFLNLSGLRSLVETEVEPVLEIGGVHRHVRHPLYLGTFLFLWGLLLAFPTASLFIAVSIITLYTLIGIRLEEKKLLLQFGEAYAAYQKSVPMLVPKP